MTVTQPDLFSATRDATDDAIARADEHADDAWKSAALDAIQAVAASHGSFTTDEVWDWLHDHRPDVSTHEPAALGPVMRRARTLGWIVPTGGWQPRSRFSRRHRQLMIWRGVK